MLRSLKKWLRLELVLFVVNIWGHWDRCPLVCPLKLNLILFSAPCKVWINIFLMSTGPAAKHNFLFCLGNSLHKAVPQSKATVAAIGQLVLPPKQLYKPSRCWLHRLSRGQDQSRCLNPGWDPPLWPFIRILNPAQLCWHSLSIYPASVCCMSVTLPDVTAAVTPSTGQKHLVTCEGNHVMITPSCVCLFVCLLAKYIVNQWTDFTEPLRKYLLCIHLQLMSFMSVLKNDSLWLSEANLSK